MGASTNIIAQGQDPKISPDGSKVVFEKFITSPNPPGGEYDIFTMNLDGTGATDITSDSQTSNNQPTWSPNGTKIAFTNYRNNGSANIYTMNPDGTSVYAVAGDAYHNALSPTWSPDGKKIAFGAQGGKIGVVNADSSNQSFITTGI